MKRIKALIVDWSPPIVFRSWMRFREFRRKQQSINLLRDAEIAQIIEPNIQEVFTSPDWALFRSHISDAETYSEWGSGASTLYAAQKSNNLFLSVETDEKWFRAMDTLVPGKLVHVDLGPTEGWGRPRDYAKRHEYENYLEAPFLQGPPDLILIDGRFRVACFFSVLLKARPGTKIIFDDYVDRPHYHLVEEYVRPAEIIGRQAAFVVPKTIDKKQILKELEKFVYVMD